MKRPAQSATVTDLRNAGAALALSLLLIVAGHADATEPKEKSGTTTEYEKARGDALDAYIAGRLVTAYALSEHLRRFALEVDVKNGSVTLSGVVENAVQRDLAVEIARGIEQARTVHSDIRVDAERARASVARDVDFAQKFADAAITARVKSRLMLNGSTQGLAINVDTELNAVRLSGEVASGVESALAEQIAFNTSGVALVENHLKVARRAAAAAVLLSGRAAASR